MPLRQLFPALNVDDSGTESIPKVDIIAVHGLNPRSKDDAEHAWNTWRTPDGPKGRLWLRDDLPNHTPAARIFLYEYNSTAVYGRDRSTFIDKANEFLEAIRVKRDDDEEDRPLVLLGHSLGGLLIEQALVNAHNNPKYSHIKNSTKGLAFFGTPHNGGSKALVTVGAITTKIATSLEFQKGDDILETLKSGSMFTDILQDLWRHQLLKYSIVSFWGAFDNIVPRDSARFGLPGDRENIVKLNANHHSICKFGTSQTDQDNFELVGSNIKDLYKIAIKAGELVSLNSLGTQNLASDSDKDEALQSRFVARVDSPGPSKISIEEKRCKILRALYKTDEGLADGSTDYESHKARNPLRAAGTCEWFFRNPKYLQWREASNSALLWLTADAGCGKSILSSTIIDKLRDQSSQRSLPGIVCHFFFRNDNKLQADAITALRAILHQIISTVSTLPHSFMVEYENKGDMIFAQFDTLWRLFLAMVSISSTNVICILDGLDECDSKTQNILLASISQYYDKINESRDSNLETPPHLKMFVTGRPLNAITTRLRKFAHCHVRGDDHEISIIHDISLVIDKNLKFLVDEDLIQQSTMYLLREKLLRGNDKTFLWVALVLDLLKQHAEEGASEMELLALLDDRSINALYATFLGQLLNRPSDVAQTKSFLQIIVAAARPLSLTEMDYALSIHTEHRSMNNLSPCLHISTESYLRRLGGSFVAFRQQKVYLVHQTAREFILLNANDTRHEETTFGPWWHSIRLDSAHNVLANSCIRYLLFDDMGMCPDVASHWTKDQEIARKKLIQTHPFIHYAANYWHLHVREGLVEKDDPLTDLIWTLCNTRDIRFWNWVYAASPPWVKQATTASSAVGNLDLGKLNDWPLAHLDGTSGICIDDETEPPPILWATMYKHVNLVKLLFIINPNVYTMYRYGNFKILQIALEDAVSFSPTKTSSQMIVDILVENKVSLIDAFLFFTRSGNSTVIKYCMQHLKISVKGIRTVETQYTALHLAVMYGWLDILELFCESPESSLIKRIFINAKDHDGRTALDFANVLGNQEIISYLIQHGAEYSKNFGHRFSYEKPSGGKRFFPDEQSTKAVWCRTQEEAVRNRIQQTPYREWGIRYLPKLMTQAIEDEIDRPLAKGDLLQSNKISSVRLLSKLDKAKEERERLEQKFMTVVNNPYYVLGVRPSERLDFDKIRSRYHEGLLAYHPDKQMRNKLNDRGKIIAPISNVRTRDESIGFQDIKEAYEFLSDLKQKAEYDKHMGYLE